MKKNLIIAVLLLFTVNAFTQKLTIKEFEQAKKTLSFEKDEAKKAKLLNRLAVYYIMRFDSPEDIDSCSVLNQQSLSLGLKLKSKKIIAASMLVDGQIANRRKDKVLAAKLKNKALEYAHKNGLKKQEAEAYLDMSCDFDDYKDALPYVQKANQLFKASHDLYGEAETYYNIAFIYEEKKNADSTFKYLQKSVKLKKTIHNYELYKDYSNLTRYYWKRGNIKEALDHGLQADLLAENADAGPKWRTLIYNLLAIINNALNHQEKSLEFYKKSIEMAKKTKSAIYLETIQVNSAKSLYDNGRFKEALEILKTVKGDPTVDCKVRNLSMYMVLYSSIKQFDNARSYYEKVLKCEMNEKEKQYVYPIIIKYLIQTGQASKAYYYINMIQKMEGSSNLKNLSIIERTFSSIDSATGNYHGAFEHFKNYKSLNDSIFNTKSSQQYNDLQLKYDTEKKDKSIILLTQHGKLQEEIIRNASILRYVFIGSICTLLLFVLLLYNRSRLKQRAHKNLEYKQQQINEQNEALKKLLSEKEWLLKEIHHRVKNNLQIVISLLGTQSMYLDNEDALTAIQNSQHRMYAMSLIHQKLYQSDAIAYIDMSWYIQELVRYLKESFAVDQNIDFKLDMECVELDVVQAVPLGLILNEAISNSIKYAFAGKEKGQINISLKNIESNSYQLLIADDGVGLPEGFESQERESLGMNLMIGLTDQLNGSLELKNNNGLTIVITFTKKGDLLNTNQNDVNATDLKMQ
jgi:two-component sensor histidine kinase